MVSAGAQEMATTKGAGGGAVDEGGGATKALVDRVVRDLDPSLRSPLAGFLSRHMQEGRQASLQDDYDECPEVLGKGAFAVVVAARHRPSTRPCAVKVVRTDGLEPRKQVETMHAVLAEAGAHALLRHATLVPLVDLIIEEHRACLVMERCDGGSLLARVQAAVNRNKREAQMRQQSGEREDYTERRQSGNRAGASVSRPGSAARARPGSARPTSARPGSARPKTGSSSSSDGGSYGGIPEREARIVISRLAQALQYMHSRGFVHRDIKLENLLLARPNDLSSIQLADFGFTCRSHGGPVQTDRMTGKLHGTLEYAAPEVLTETSHGRGGTTNALTTHPAVDVWSAGVTLFLMLGGYHLFDSSSQSMEMRKNMPATLDREFQKQCWRSVSGEGRALLRRMCQSDPRARPHVAELLADPFTTGAGLGRGHAPLVKDSAEELRPRRLEPLAGGKPPTAVPGRPWASHRLIK